MNNNINLLFYSLWKPASINYGKDGGATAATAIISILSSVFLISIIGIINKTIFDINTMSIYVFLIIYIFSLVICYSIFYFDKKYTKIIDHYDSNQPTVINRTVTILTCLILCFGSFIFTVLYIR